MPPALGRLHCWVPVYKAPKLYKPQKIPRQFEETLGAVVPASKVLGSSGAQAEPYKLRLHLGLVQRVQIKDRQNWGVPNIGVPLVWEVVILGGGIY